MKNRKLTENERKQLKITKLFHQKRLNNKFNLKRIVITGLLSIGFILIIYYFDDYWFSLIAKIGIAITPIMIWGWISSYKGDRKESMKLLKVIEKVEANEEVAVVEYECRQAIYFPNHEDEGVCHALEIGDNQLMFWWDIDFSEGGILPNTKFEVFNDNDLELIFGKRITILGTPIQPIGIRSEIKWDNWGELPNHREIIESTVGDYLNELEKKYTV
jgi:hypothetical protein